MSTIDTSKILLINKSCPVEKWEGPKFEPINEGVLHITKDGLYNVERYTEADVNRDIIWGEITGDLADQTDLQVVLNAEQTARTNADTALQAAIESVDNKTDTNTANIATNTANIASHTQSIATHTTDISSLQQTVNNHTQAIDNNTALIKDKTEDLAADIAKNKTAIDANTQAIADNKNAVDNELTAHKESINTLTDKTTENATEITNLYGKIEQNGRAIAANEESIAANKREIISLKEATDDAIDELKAGINANKEGITASDTRIEANTQSIAANKTAITANSSKIAANTTKIAEVATDLATNYYNKTDTDSKITAVEDKITALGSVMNYKGTKATTADLPATGNKTGDVWHVTADSGEYAWDGTEWQELGSTIDLSGYVTDSALTTKLAGYEKNGNKVTSMSATSTDAQYPSAKAVYTALSGKANSSHSHAISDITNLQTTLDEHRSAINTNATTIASHAESISTNSQFITNLSKKMQDTLDELKPLIYAGL